MGRLVKLDENNVAQCAGLIDSLDWCAEFDECYDCPHFHDILAKLARYEDAEERKEND